MCRRTSDEALVGHISPKSADDAGHGPPSGTLRARQLASRGGGASVTARTDCTVGTAEGRSRPDPDPIAGFEDWPAAVRTAAPYQRTDATGTALGRLLGLRRSPARPPVIDEGGQIVDGVSVRRLRWSV